MRGSFETPDHEAAEPARTERLLARPFALIRPVASDAHASISQVVLARGSGGTLIGMFYDWLALVVQLALAALLGIGDALEWGSSVAAAYTPWDLILSHGPHPVGPYSEPRLSTAESLLISH
jgi:hypothetical protein